MKRKVMALTAMAALALVLGAVTYSVTLAQPGRSAEIYAQAEGDDTVVARVSGLPVTRGVVRKASAINKQFDSTLTDSQADKRAIVPIIHRKALVAEALNRGLTPTDKDVAAFIQRRKYDCTGPGAEACQAAIADTGMSEADFWVAAEPDYRDALLLNRVYADHYADVGIDENSTEDEVWQARVAFGLDIQAAASIEWEDDELKRLYEEAASE
ncbi:MAG: hypothetical protein OXN21_14525 [Chloroflexota bacterium]|nr:hypothetical protein [Chloroflexota bacterium]